MTPLSSTRRPTKQGFLQHINSVDPAIKFTVENNKEDGFIPFLDTIVKPEENGGLSITVYWRPTHTDQYLQWDSHHNLSDKFSVINTLSHRAQTVCINPELLKQEKRIPQEGSHQMQISQVGFGQSGEKAQQAFQ